MRGLEWVSRMAVAAAVLLILVFTLGQVVDRYFLKGTFNAYDQIARIGLVWMTFIGIAMAFRERLNIVVDLIDRLLPPRVVAVKRFALDLLSVLVVVLLVGYAQRLMDIGNYQRIMGTPFTYSHVYSALLVGSILLLFFLLARITAQVVAFLAAPKQKST